jgi:hypothetical protein
VDDADQARHARREARRNRALAWAWSLVLIPPGCVFYVILPLEQFTAMTVLATWILSVVTLSITQASVAKAAEAKAAGYEHP